MKTVYPWPIADPCNCLGLTGGKLPVGMVLVAKKAPAVREQCDPDGPQLKVRKLFQKRRLGH